MNGHVDFVVAADLPAVASEEERCVTNRAVRLDGVGAADQIHMLRGRGLAQAVQHAFHRLGQYFLQGPLVGCLPGAESQGVLRQDERVTLGRAGLAHDLLKLAQRAINLGQHFLGLGESVIN